MRHDDPAVRRSACALDGLAMLCASCIPHGAIAPNSPAAVGTIVASRVTSDRSMFVAVDPITRQCAPIGGIAGEPVACAPLHVAGTSRVLLTTRVRGTDPVGDAYHFYLWSPGWAAREVTVSAMSGPYQAAGSAVTCVAPGGSRVYVWEGRPQPAGERLTRRPVREIDLASGGVRRLLLRARQPAGDVAAAPSADGSAAIEWDEGSRWDDGGPAVAVDLRAGPIVGGISETLPLPPSLEREQAVEGVWWSLDGSSAAVLMVDDLLLYRMRPGMPTLARRVRLRRATVTVPVGWARDGMFRWIEAEVGGVPVVPVVRSVATGGSSARVSTDASVDLPAEVASGDSAIGCVAAPESDPGRGLALTTTDGELLIEEDAGGPCQQVRGRFDHAPTLLCWTR